MKVKVLAFPLLLAGSLALFIWMIAPAYEDYKNKKSTLAAKETELAGIQAKTQKINDLSASLASHENQGLLIYRFLPQARNEEEIINGVDNLAKSALVSLLNVSVDAKGTGTVPPAIDPATGAPLPPKAEVSPIGADLSLSGQYESIKNFLNQVYTLDKFNNISTISISKAAAASAETEAAVTAAGILTLQMKVDFGYLPKAGVDLNPEVYSYPASEFDFSTADSIAKKVKTPNVDIGASGRANPFLSQ